MARVDQVNDLLREKIARTIEREIELDNILVTITDVDCSPDLKSAKVKFSVLPDNKVGTTLEKLKKSTSAIVKVLRKETRLRVIPRLRWTFDDTGKHVSKLDEIFSKIENGEEIEDDTPINFE